MDQSPLIPVYNLRMAQELLKLNYTIKDIRINKKDPTKLKFLFVRDSTIENTIQQLLNNFKKTN